MHNQGANTISSGLHLLRSTDATIDETDAYIYLFSLASSLKSSETQTMSLDWIAPPYAGTYYYGVCGYAFTNCSTGVRVTVEGNEGGTPDLIVHTPLVSHKSVTPGSRFSFRAKVENIGTSPAATTTTHFYLSNDATIDATDKQINRSSLFPMKRFIVGASFRYSYHWNAPFKKGTYYYGLCVHPTIGETNIDNNCSTGVPIIVEDSEEGRPDLDCYSPFDPRSQADARGVSAVGDGAKYRIGSIRQYHVALLPLGRCDHRCDRYATPHETRRFTHCRWLEGRPSIHRMIFLI